MINKLNELFDLPDAPISPSKEVSDALATANTIEANLPALPEDALDQELDQLADQAVESFENLQSLGMNVEARFSAPIFDAASKMLGHAVTAKLGKVQKKLKQAELLMRAERLAMQKAEMENTTTSAPDIVEAKVFDRNELLKTFGKR